MYLLCICLYLANKVLLLLLLLQWLFRNLVTGKAKRVGSPQRFMGRICWALGRVCCRLQCWCRHRCLPTTNDACGACMPVHFSTTVLRSIYFMPGRRPWRCGVSRWPASCLVSTITVLLLQSVIRFTPGWTEWLKLKDQHCFSDNVNN